MSCNRCGTDQTNLEYCVYCKQYMDLQAAYVELQDRAYGYHTMTDEDFASLERVRAMCHGGGAAVAVAMEGEGGLSLPNMREMLQAGNRRLQQIVEHYGGYHRVVKLREQGKIDADV